jgi:hypothetical protein
MKRVALSRQGKNETGLKGWVRVCGSKIRPCGALLAPITSGDLGAGWRHFPGSGSGLLAGCLLCAHRTDRGSAIANGRSFECEGHRSFEKRSSLAIADRWCLRHPKPVILRNPQMEILIARQSIPVLKVHPRCSMESFGAWADPSEICRNSR